MVPFNPVMLEIGPFTITWYSFLIIFSIILGLIYFYAMTKKMGITKNQFYDLSFYILLFGLLGARLWEIILQWEYYGQNLSQIIAIWNGGLSIQGAIIAGIVVIWLWSKKHKYNPLAITDAIVPALFLGQAIGRWGNFINQEVYGKPIGNTLEEGYQFLTEILHFTDPMANQMLIDGSYHLPIFFFESTLCLVGLVIVLLFKFILKMRIGFITGFYFIWYGLVRMIMETLKTSQLTILNLNISGPMLVTVMMIIFGVIIIIFIYKKQKIKE